jgi:hypothetical protein
VPEPNYAGDESPGFWVIIIGLAVCFVGLLLLRGC